MTGISILSVSGPGNANSGLFLSSAQRWNDLACELATSRAAPQVCRRNAGCATYAGMLGPLDWPHFPERNLLRHWCQPAVLYALCRSHAGQAHKGLDSMGDLRQYLIEHPALVPLLASV